VKKPARKKYKEYFSNKKKELPLFQSNCWEIYKLNSWN